MKHTNPTLLIAVMTGTCHDCVEVHPKLVIEPVVPDGQDQDEINMHAAELMYCHLTRTKTDGPDFFALYTMTLDELDATAHLRDFDFLQVLRLSANFVICSHNPHGPCDCESGITSAVA